MLGRVGGQTVSGKAVPCAHPTTACVCMYVLAKRLSRGRVCDGRQTEKKGVALYFCLDQLGEREK